MNARAIRLTSKGQPELPRRRQTHSDRLILVMCLDPNMGWAIEQA